MHLKALLLIPQRLPCHVVAFVPATSAGLLPTCFRICGPVINCTRSRWNEFYRPISSTANVARGNVLKTIGNYTRNHPVSIFYSQSDNPYHNLAIENYILKNSDPHSKILFFYTNRPCVVIGRNQNPWLECNIARIQGGLPKDDLSSAEPSKGQDPNKQNEINPTIPLDLVRRRSGGGTVIHDNGNLNFSFIVPNDKDFTRDKHGELVVQSLLAPKLMDKFADCTMYESVRVNERHDIVMECKGDETRKEFKVSGSAFKLTRGRALHHGTVLHSSPNVDRHVLVSRDEGGMVSAGVFSALLSSPAKPYLEAKGVASVRSPVHNLFHVQSLQQRHELTTALREEIGRLFIQAYDAGDVPVVEVGDDDCLEQTNLDVYQDVQEIMTDDWRYCQTPTFEYRSGEATEHLNMQFQVKQGTIKGTLLSGRVDLSKEQRSAFSELEGKKLHEIQSWNEYLPSFQKFRSGKAIGHLNMVFPRIDVAQTNHERKAEYDAIKEMGLESSHAGSDISRELESGNIEVEDQGENTVIEHQTRPQP